MIRISRHILFVLAGLCLVSIAQAAQWTTAPGSTLGFTGKAQGETFEGTFKTFSADVRFDPDALEGSRFDVEIDLRSVDSQNSERDEMLADGAFFNSTAEPTARYVATTFSALADGRFRAAGTLTLRGVALSVPLDFSWSSDTSNAALNGEATLDRLAFHVGDGEWADADAIAHAVRVSTNLKLTPASNATP